MTQPIKAAKEFAINSAPLYCKRYGNGHINDTYLVIDNSDTRYILQKLNKNVFIKPEYVMENVLAVTNYLKPLVRESREALSLVPLKCGENWLVDPHGEYWRMYSFITDSLCLEKAETPDDFLESGVTFGKFQNLLADFPAHSLHETIPNFHHTPKRYERFRTILAADTHDRAKLAAREIDFALSREEYAKTLINLQEKGEMPLRVTHNDTKLNNVLFDNKTRKGLCVIDLDTVMPGLAVNDFGDSIRFGASTATEDETDLTKVNLSMPLFKAYTAGFVSACGENLTTIELHHLRDGAKMMTLECGVRFLTDYLEGDVYFRTHRDNHNLDRCRTQFKLVQGMEARWDEMQLIILQTG